MARVSTKQFYKGYRFALVYYVFAEKHHLGLSRIEVLPDQKLEIFRGIAVSSKKLKHETVVANALANKKLTVECYLDCAEQPDFRTSLTFYGRQYVFSFTHFDDLPLVLHSEDMIALEGICFRGVKLEEMREFLPLAPPVVQEGTPDANGNATYQTDGGIKETE